MGYDPIGAEQMRLGDPCQTCGEPASLPGARFCNACWEVQSRLETYLRRGGSKARKFVHTAMVNTEDPGEGLVD